MRVYLVLVGGTVNAAEKKTRSYLGTRLLPKRDIT